MLLKVIT